MKSMNKYKIKKKFRITKITGLFSCVIGTLALALMPKNMINSLEQFLYLAFITIGGISNLLENNLWWIELLGCIFYGLSVIISIFTYDFINLNTLFSLLLLMITLIRTIRLFNITHSSALNKNINAFNTQYNFNDMTGTDFEIFCASILKMNNFIKVFVTPKSGDHGIDILAEKDGITYAIQCKKYSGHVGNDAVQQAHTGKSIYGRDIAVVLTNNTFTDQATNEAKILGVKLWDINKLNEMIKNSKEN